MQGWPPYFTVCMPRHAPAFNVPPSASCFHYARRLGLRPLLRLLSAFSFLVELFCPLSENGLKSYASDWLMSQWEGPCSLTWHDVDHNTTTPTATAFSLGSRGREKAGAQFDCPTENPTEFSTEFPTELLIKSYTIKIQKMEVWTCLTTR